MSHQHPSNPPWSELPMFPVGRWVITDEDIEAWSDITYMRTLVDAIGEHLTAQDALTVFHDISAMSEDADWQQRNFRDHWPHDRAADMLTAWRLATGPGPARLAVEAVPA